MRARRELACKRRDIALFNVAIYSSLCGCDLVRLKVSDLVSSGRMHECVSVIWSKTEQPLQVERTENTCRSVKTWVSWQEMVGCAFMFLSRFHDRPDISTRLYGRLVRDQVVALGLKPSGSACKRRWRRADAVRHAVLPGQHPGTRRRVFGISMAAVALKVPITACVPKRQTGSQESVRRPAGPVCPRLQLRSSWLALTKPDTRCTYVQPARGAPGRKAPSDFARSV